MPVKRELNKDSIILYLEGGLTIYEVTEIRNQVLDCLNFSDKLVVDFEAVSECDPAGLQLLYAIVSSVNTRQKKICLVKIPTIVKNAVNQSGFDFNDLFLT